MEDVMSEAAPQVLEELDEKAAPLFVDYLEVKGIDYPGSLEDYVEEARGSYETNEQNIISEIERLRTELEQTRENRESYDRFFG